MDNLKLNLYKLSARDSSSTNYLLIFLMVLLLITLLEDDIFKKVESKSNERPVIFRNT